MTLQSIRFRQHFHGYIHLLRRSFDRIAQSFGLVHACRMLERMQRQHRSGKLLYLLQVTVSITQQRLRSDRLKVQHPAAVCGSKQI